MSEDILRALRTAQPDVPEGVIDLGVGQPDFDLLPLALMRQAADHALSQTDPAILQYGLEPGDGRFRQALAHFLTTGYNFPVSYDQLFITNGASQALDLICTRVTQPGDVVFVEEPTYFLALGIFADHRLQVRAVPTDAAGLDVDVLAAMLARERPSFLYTIPTFQNPTGATLPAERRQQLVQLSREHDFLLVADEVYQLLVYTAIPPAPLARNIAADTVISIGSFSKILAPGLRLGWIQAAPAILHRLIGSGVVHSGGGLNPFTGTIVCALLEQGWLDEHLDRLRQTYGERTAILSQALKEALGQNCRFTTPNGGFFIWVELPPRVDAAQLRETAVRHHGVNFQPGVKFSSKGGLRHYARLSFAFYDSSQLTAAAHRLGAALNTWLAA